MSLLAGRASRASASSPPALPSRTSSSSASATPRRLNDALLRRGCHRSADGLVRRAGRPPDHGRHARRDRVCSATRSPTMLGRRRHVKSSRQLRRDSGPRGREPRPVAELSSAVGRPAGRSCSFAQGSGPLFMRTTLKRGLGRGAAPNGNGKAVLPPGVVLARDASTASRSRSRRSRARARSGRSRCGSGSRASSSRPAPPAARTSTSTSPSPPSRRRRPRCARRRGSSTSPLPGQPAVALVIGYDASQGGRAERAGALGHAHARARGSVDRLDLAPLVPARHARRDPLPGRTPFFDKINAAYATCGPQGSLQTVRALTGRPDQLPDHRQLPRLPADRRPARRRVDRRRPALLQRSRRAVRLREDQPASRATSSSPGGRRSTTCATGTRTRTSTASRASSSS